MERFIADFSRFFDTNAKIYLLGDQLGTCHQIQAFQRFACNILISQVPKP